MRGLYEGGGADGQAGEFLNRRVVKVTEVDSVDNNIVILKLYDGTLAEKVKNIMHRRCNGFKSVFSETIYFAQRQFMLGQVYFTL